MARGPVYQKREGEDRELRCVYNTNSKEASFGG
jgi:hypothetical protein